MCWGTPIVPVAQSSWSGSTISRMKLWVWKLGPSASWFLPMFHCFAALLRKWVKVFRWPKLRHSAPSWRSSRVKHRFAIYYIYIYNVLFQEDVNHLELVMSCRGGIVFYNTIQYGTFRMWPAEQSYLIPFWLPEMKTGWDDVIEWLLWYLVTSGTKSVLMLIWYCIWCPGDVRHVLNPTVCLIPQGFGYSQSV